MVMIVAAVAIVANGGVALMFMRGREKDLNIRGAFLHMAADAGVSVGVLVAAWVITLTGAVWLDPVDEPGDFSGDPHRQLGPAAGCDDAGHGCGAAKHRPRRRQRAAFWRCPA